MLTKNSVLINAYYVRLQVYQDDTIYNLVISGCLFICKIKNCTNTHVFFYFTVKQAATYYEVINCIVLIKLKPDVVSTTYEMGG